jgi:hypothetical protein
VGEAGSLHSPRFSKIQQDSARADAEKASESQLKYGGTGYQKRFERSISITDTTRIGTQLTHTYRAKNKLGALVLDSTPFVVYKNGQVVPR